MKLKSFLSLFLFSAVLGVSFTSCDNDDDNNGGNNNADKLNGTLWKVSKTEANVEAEDSAIQKQVSDFIVKMNPEGGITYSFKDGKAQEKYGDKVFDLAKYTLKGDKIEFEKNDTTGISLTYKDSAIIGLSDVKKYVAEQLKIDTAQITKAEKKDTFISVLK